DAPRRCVHAPVVELTQQMLVVEHSASAAQARLAIAKHIPREAEPSAKDVVVSQNAIFRHARVTSEQYAGRRIGELGSPDAGDKVWNCEALNSPPHLVPGWRRLIPQAQVQRQARMYLVVVLDQQCRVSGTVVLVLTRSLVEGCQLTEQKVRNGMSGPEGGVRGEHIVTCATEFVHNIHSIAGDLSTELQSVLSADPAHAIAPLKTIAYELRFQIVANREEPGRLNLGDGRQ